MLKLFLSATLFFVLGGCSSDDEPPPKELTFAEQYPGPWHTEIRGDITKSLAHHQARGCGVYVYKPRYNIDSEFLVYCSPDGSSDWTAFLVWPNIDEVTGPSTIAASIPPPALSEL
jgi:hypothetical protein